MKSFIASLFLAGTCLSGLVLSAGAAEMRGVVELFTSQGCSSCPPADQLLSELSADPSLVTLSFAVDYWDYIGWKDTLALPMCTARQKAYASARGDGQVYTPQVVIDGVVHAVGSDGAEVRNALQTGLQHKGVLNIQVSARPTGGNLRIDVAGASADGIKSANLWLLRVAHKRNVSIGRGENSGRSVTYTNVVRSMVKLGEWSGQAKGFDTAEPARDSDGDGYVLLLQASENGKPGTILGAARSAGL